MERDNLEEARKKLVDALSFETNRRKTFKTYYKNDFNLDPHLNEYGEKFMKVTRDIEERLNRDAEQDFYRKIYLAAKDFVKIFEEVYEGEGF